MDHDVIQKVKERIISKNKLEMESHGLGLQLCIYFAKLIEVELDFMKNDGKGTTVFMEIPLN